MWNTLARMLHTGVLTEPFPLHDSSAAVPDTMQNELREIMGRALCIRHVDAGSCNGCELEIVALNNPYYNLEGAGLKFVASPRHADMLLVTGPVSVNMEEALKRAYDAMPDPKWVVAVGDCADCGGIFGKSYASRAAIADIIPVNSQVSGCPPTPAAILSTILKTIRSPKDEDAHGIDRNK
jgi:Ni,Fe-hydrogenase III small subunit